MTDQKRNGLSYVPCFLPPGSYYKYTRKYYTLKYISHHEQHPIFAVSAALHLLAPCLRAGRCRENAIAVFQS
jgi:hypothetical protein